MDELFKAFSAYGLWGIVAWVAFTELQRWLARREREKQGKRIEMLTSALYVMHEQNARSQERFNIVLELIALGMLPPAVQVRVAEKLEESRADPCKPLQINGEDK